VVTEWVLQTFYNTAERRLPELIGGKCGSDNPKFGQLAYILIHEKQYYNTYNVLYYYNNKNQKNFKAGEA
jgi:hypothetical protein